MTRRIGDSARSGLGSSTQGTFIAPTATVRSGRGRRGISATTTLTARFTRARSTAVVIGRPRREASSSCAGESGRASRACGDPVDGALQQETPSSSTCAARTPRPWSPSAPPPRTAALETRRAIGPGGPPLRVLDAVGDPLEPILRGGLPSANVVANARVGPPVRVPGRAHELEHEEVTIPGRHQPPATPGFTFREAVPSRIGDVPCIRARRSDGKRKCHAHNCCCCFPHRSQLSLPGSDSAWRSELLHRVHLRHHLLGALTSILPDTHANAGRDGGG